MTSAVVTPIDRPTPQLVGWIDLQPVPCTLTVEAEVKGFTIEEFLGLAKGSIVSSAHNYGTDVRVLLNGHAIAFCEFAAAGLKLAARITEIG